MRATKQFDAFGLTYRVKQFSAAEGLDMLANPREWEATEMLAHTEVKAGSDWIALDSRAAINAHVRDAVGFLSPTDALICVMSMVHEMDFKFLEGWKAITFPRRLVQKGVDVKELVGVHPVMEHLVTEGKATMKELQEFYSLQDAFQMYDMATHAALRNALAQEAAAADAKAKAGR